ncbi:MAG: beta-glucanase (GH16 family) [Cryomorphaceae bacterium]|jgi:beta-glucanase (GH16 family)
MKRSALTTLFSVFCLLSFSQSNNSPYTDLVWSDEFNGNGTINTSKWHHQTLLPNGNSWFNGELQHYTNRDENSYQSGGSLFINAINESFSDQGITKNYTSARLNSKFAFTYGRVVVKAKLPQGAGTWPAIWMLGKDITEPGGYWFDQFGSQSWPACGEIDIMEHWGANPNYISAALHTPSSFGGTVNVGGTNLPDVFNTFHIYEMEWSPERIVFSVDGNEFYTYEPASQTPSTWPFDSDQYLLLNVAINGNITQGFDQSAMEIDYVRVYQEPEIDESFNPTSQVFVNGVLFSWNLPDGAIGCQVKGGPVGGSDGGDVTVVNPNPDFVFVNSNALGSGEFQWKVRCATAINPPQGITNFSSYDTFVFPPNANAVEAPAELQKKAVSKW